MFKGYPRWRKVIRDIWLNKTRTILVILSIAAGMFAIGAISTTQIVLAHDMASAYEMVNPPSATIGVAPFKEDVLDAVRTLPEVHAAEARRIISVRVQTQPGIWGDMNLYTIRDFANIRVDTIFSEVGAWPPPPKQLLLERNSLELIPIQIGNTLTLELPDGRQRTMRVAGLAHHLLVSPAQFSGIAYGYISLDTLEWLGFSRDFTTLQFNVAEQRDSRAHIERVAEKVRQRIENSKHVVFNTTIPPPGKHPISDALEPLLLILNMLGYLALIMSGFLVVNTINSLLGQQIKQIGIMKSIGASSLQLLTVYLVMVLMFGLAALLIAIPLGALGAYGMTRYAAGILNFEITSSLIQPQVLILQIIFGMFVPMFAAFVPILNGVTISVRAAIYSEWQITGFGNSLVDQTLQRVRGLPSPILLALRNMVRAKGRLALTLTTLIIGGATFIAVYSVRASLINTLNNAKSYRVYDLEIRFSQPYRAEALEQVALSFPSVNKIENWSLSAGRRLRNDGTESNGLQIIALPPQTDMVHPTILNGRWLLPEDTNAIVVNTDVLRDETDIQVGKTIKLKINLKEQEYQVVGVARSTLSGAQIFLPYTYYTAHIAGESGRATMALIRMDGTDQDKKQIGQELEQRYKNSDYDISSTRATPAIVRSLTMQFDLLTVFLFIMAIIVAGVSGLGLSGAMSMNVLERTREIGVMRSVGASDLIVLMVFLLEGVFIGVVSWIGGSIFAYPLSIILSNQVGNSLVRAPLLYTFPPEGVALWLVSSIFLAAIATYAPAHRASMLSVREVLSYE